MRVPGICASPVLPPENCHQFSEKQRDLVESRALAVGSIKSAKTPSGMGPDGGWGPWVDDLVDASENWGTRIRT